MGTSPEVLTEKVWGMVHLAASVISDDVAMIARKTSRGIAMASPLSGEHGGWKRVPAVLCADGNHSFECKAFVKEIFQFP